MLTAPISRKAFLINLALMYVAGFAFIFIAVGIIADPNGINLFERTIVEALLIVFGGLIIAPIAAAQALFGGPSSPETWFSGVFLIFSMLLGLWQRAKLAARLVTYLALACWCAIGTFYFCFLA